MKVLCIGESTYDISVNTNYFPLENSFNIFNERVETAGGMIPNIAYFLGKSNIEVYNASMVGNDDYGSFIKKELEVAHVKTDFIETSYQDKTNINFNIGDVVWIRKPNGKDTDQFIFANASYTK